MDTIPDSHPGVPGSIPWWGLFLYFTSILPNFQGQKKTLFQRKDLDLNLPKSSTYSACSFKPKKFMVGHFDLGRDVWLRNLESVKYMYEIKTWIEYT